MNQSAQHIDLPEMTLPPELPVEGGLIATNVKITARNSDLCVWVILPGLTACTPIRLAAGYDHPSTQNLTQRERLLIRALLTTALGQV